MCWKKIKQWEIWTWSLWKWMKIACKAVKNFFFGKKALKFYDNFFNFLFFVLIIGALGGIIVISPIFSFAYVRNTSYDWTHQREDIILETDDYFLWRYNINGNYTWTWHLNVETPQIRFKVYFVSDSNIFYINNKVQIDIPEESHTIVGDSHWDFEFTPPYHSIWHFIILNNEDEPVKFDLEMELIDNRDTFINTLFAVLETWSNYWLVPLVSLFSLIGSVYLLSKFLDEKLSEEKDENENGEKDKPKIIYQVIAEEGRTRYPLRKRYRPRDQ
ncbi:MAG: hypothetical protein GF308_21900 [Candidatus Heimdallarchaeota archaeon]|nr:hypothetical protein [Candidatus Heimdallarchaeota archaeon]